MIGLLQIPNGTDLLLGGLCPTPQSNVETGTDFRGDTTSLWETLEETVENLVEVIDEPREEDCVEWNIVEKVVLDNGYHSNDTCRDLLESEIRSYASEPERGRRKWKDKEAERDAVYGKWEGIEISVF